MKELPGTLGIPAGVAEFILKPRALPHPQGDLGAYLRACEQKLLEMLVEATDRRSRALPDRTIMVQCLSKPPVEGHADFSLPVLIRADEVGEACRFAASFAHVTHYLMKGKSSHIRMRDLGDCTRGNLVVFASKTPTHWLRAQFANVLHIALPVESRRQAPDFGSIYGPLEKGFLASVSGAERVWSFNMEAFVKDAEEHGWTSIVDALADGIVAEARAMPCQRARRPGRTSDVLADILADTQPKGEYLERVSVLLNCGQIILCLPQTHYFEDGGEQTHHPDTVVYDSGLTIVLKGDAPVSQAEMEQCYWIGYKISSFLASFHGLAKKLAIEVRRDLTHSLARALSHEVANAGLVIRSITDKVALPADIKKDIAARTIIAATAARAVVAEVSSKRKAVSAQTTEITDQYCDFVDFRLQVNCDFGALSMVELPMTYELLLNELIRNAYKHSAETSDGVKHAKLEIILDRTANVLIVSLKNVPEDQRKVQCLKEGMDNAGSPRLARLRELIGLLSSQRKQASLSLASVSPEICIVAKIPTKATS